MGGGVNFDKRENIAYIYPLIRYNEPPNIYNKHSDAHCTYIEFIHVFYRMFPNELLVVIELVINFRGGYLVRIINL